MADQMIAHIDDIILFPNVTCGLHVALGKRLHRSLQHTAGLFAELEHSLDNGRFGDLGTTLAISRHRFDLYIRHLSAMQRHHTQNDLSNSSCTIAYTLKLTRYREGRGEIAQVASSQWLLQRQ